ncbi:MAG: succinate dehydrogenase, hydrophobic membrane anchor protein [Rhodospirillales bacterium]|nr:succinate dehydrogenase, hydrophobic membrane anchor protein [Rhodospirillales bacterium]
MSNRKLGPSKSGTSHWWHQRLTAIALIPLVIFLVGLLPNLADATHREFVALMQIPFTPIALVLLIIAGIYHMKLGLQVVIEDYVHNEPVKVGLIIALTLGSIFLAVAGTVSIIMLAS